MGCRKLVAFKNAVRKIIKAGRVESAARQGAQKSLVGACKRRALRALACSGPRGVTVGPKHCSGTLGGAEARGASGTPAGGLEGPSAAAGFRRPGP